jgi:hypothetical protein
VAFGNVSAVLASSALLAEAEASAYSTDEQRYRHRGCSGRSLDLRWIQAFSRRLE